MKKNEQNRDGLLASILFPSIDFDITEMGRSKLGDEGQTVSWIFLVEVVGKMSAVVVKSVAAAARRTLSSFCLPDLDDPVPDLPVDILPLKRWTATRLTFWSKKREKSTFK